jgi:hypothetical protein
MVSATAIVRWCVAADPRLSWIRYSRSERKLGDQVADRRIVTLAPISAIKKSYSSGQDLETEVA